MHRVGVGIAQYPTLLPKTPLTINNSAAPFATLVGVAIVFGLTIVLVGPAFVILFRLYGREALQSDEAYF